MPQRTASAQWEGSLRDGNGTMQLASGAYAGKYSFGTRFEEAPGTNPEELIAAAHAGCFSMALSGALGKAGHQPRRVATTAVVSLEKGETGFAITRILLKTSGDVPGISAEDFQRVAEEAKKTCPVSKALAGVDIQLEASLASAG